MFKKIAVCLLMGLALAFAGCKKDAEINATLTELDSFTKELVQKVETAQGAPEGIDAAQQFLDSKKSDLKKRLDELKSLRGFQMSDATKKTLTESFTKNATQVMSLQIKYVSRSVKDSNYKAKLEKLINDYRTLLTA
ncbi:MAG: hypothetical protein AB1757_23440 [Acidobacteriota bacterium]